MLHDIWWTDSANSYYAQTVHFIIKSWQIIHACVFLYTTILWYSMCACGLVCQISKLVAVLWFVTIDAMQICSMIKTFHFMYRSVARIYKWHLFHPWYVLLYICFDRYKFSWKLQARWGDQHIRTPLAIL